LSTTSNAETGGKMKPTLGLTGLTMNAMAYIAPGALMWLTYVQQCQYGAPMAGSAMWFGVVAALALCFATAVAYAELAKLYPGAGSSYFFAEQAFLSKTRYAQFARVAKYIIGWASHLYYWVYPGVMVGVTAILCGYLLGILFPTTFSASVASPLFMILFCIVFSFGVAYIAYRGVQATTNVNMAINIIQITALLIFAVMAILYRTGHDAGTYGWTLDPDGTPTQYVIAKGPDGKELKDEKTGEWLYEKDDKGEPKKILLTWDEPVSMEKDKDKPDDPGSIPTRQYFGSASSVVSPNGYSNVLIQACMAILLLVGFECVTSMSEEAKNAKRDVPRAILLSLFVQGVVCYLIAYFASNYFLNSAYTMTTAAGSSAPIGDMMQLVGAWAFGSPFAGKVFMLVQAVTVLLALVGTTLSGMATGARVTYAMGRDEEVPAHFGLLHGKNLTPHRAIWTLAVISAVIGIFAVYFYLCGPAATEAMDTALTDAQKNSIWYSFGVFKYETAKQIPNSLLIVTLTSNFGTFLLYMLTCWIAMVAFQEHHTFSGFKHMVIPVFGLLANLACMLFYLIGPIPGVVSGMSWKEPYAALVVAALWGAYGWWYFMSSSKKKGKLVVGSSPAPVQKTATATTPMSG